MATNCNLFSDMELGAIIEKLKLYGVGRRPLNDGLFAADKPPPRYGLFDIDEEDLCHEVIQSTCQVPGCTFTSESLLEMENHYNASHRYTCHQCRRMLPSPHLLDLHLQEQHDSFFAVMALKKPSYSCYIEECELKFITADERLNHCVQEHKLPKDFRFEQKSKRDKKSKPIKKVETKSSKEIDGKITETSNAGSYNKQVESSDKNSGGKFSKSDNGKNSTDDQAMTEVDNENERKNTTFAFNNSRHKTFPKYTGRTFSKDDKGMSPKEVNIDVLMADLKDSLPQ